MCVIMIRLPFRILLFTVAVFALMRGALFAVHHDYFQEASLPAALLSGSRFDLKLAVLAYSPFLLLLVLPWQKVQGRRLRRWAALACGVVLTVLVGLQMADIAYFGEVNRHIGGDLLNIGGDVGFIFQTAFSSRLGYTVGGVLFLAVMWWLWLKWVVRPEDGGLPSRFVVRVAQSAVLLVCYVFLARGMVVSGKPLNAVDAFNGTGQQQANLTLNGALVTLDAVKDRQNQIPLKYLDDKEMQNFQTAYPDAFRYQPSGQAGGKNVVFILLESWSYRFIDGLSGNNFKATPYTDNLIRHSRVWDHFYAAGQRSIIGIQASLSSVPALPDRQPLGFGLELNNMSRIAELAGKQGYRTLMVQSSNRRSFHMDGIAKALGFQEYYGKEDIPLLREYPQETPAFGWDYDSLMFLGKKISEQPKPFFAFFFSGTTHEPFADPGKEFHLHPHDNRSEQGFLNTLKYSDWSLHQFMEYAKQQTWYKDTVFVITADHTLNSGTPDSKAVERFHIPLIIFESGEQAARYGWQASQYDLLPTFADIIGVKQPVYTFGQSLLNPKQDDLPIMMNQGGSTVMLSGSETAEFDRNQIISQTPSAAPYLKQLQWRMQSADEKLRNNQWTQ